MRLCNRDMARAGFNRVTIINGPFTFGREGRGFHSSDNNRNPSLVERFSTAQATFSEGGWSNGILKSARFIWMWWAFFFTTSKLQVGFQSSPGAGGHKTQGVPPQEEARWDCLTNWEPSGFNGAMHRCIPEKKNWTGCVPRVPSVLKRGTHKTAVGEHFGTHCSAGCSMSGGAGQWMHPHNDGVKPLVRSAGHRLNVGDCPAQHSAVVAEASAIRHGVMV